MSRLRRMIEWNVFGVCTWLVKKWELLPVLYVNTLFIFLFLQWDLRSLFIFSLHSG